MSGAGCLGHFAQAAPGLRGKKKEPMGGRVRCAARGRDPRSRRDVSVNSQSPGQSPSPPEVKRRAKPSGGAKKVAGKAPGKRGGTGRTAGKRRSKTRAILDAALGRPDGSGEWDGDDATAPGVINAIVTDVDGTLLNSSQELTMRTEVAIARAAACGVPVILATGKSRGPWARRLLPKLPVPMPGVFIQGLLTCDADGTVLESIELEPDVASDVVEFAKANGASLVAFCGSRILCEARDENTDLVLDYGEPTPEAVGDLRKNMVDAGIAVNKLLLFADEDTNAMPTLRAAAEKRFDDRCSITTAVPGMLEFLPKGASKGAAVERLLKRLDIDPRNVLALGDGENDVEMLRLAGTAVAMAGSSEKVVAAAGGVVGASNDENGVAAAIETYVLSTRGLPPASEMGKIGVEIDEDEANELLAAVGVDDDADDVERRLPSPKAAAMAIQSETIRKKLEKEAAKKKEDEKGEKEEEATTVAKEERSIVEAIAKEEEEPTRGPDLEMEEARRMNAELLEASKAAAARLAALRGTLKETEEELKRSEETQARKAERRAAKAEKARVRREEEEKKSEGEEEPSLADVAAAAKASANLSGWDDDAAAADSWEIAAESEQAAAVAAAASEAARRAEAAVGELEAAAEIVEPEVATMEEAGKRDATSSSSTSSSSTSSSSTSSSSSSSSSATTAWGSIGSFFSAALKTVTSLTSPEARAKQAEAERAAGKAQLLAAVVSTNIGRDCDLDQLRAVETAVLQLESLNPTKAPMRSSLTKGRWSAVFTSSRQLLGLDKKLSLTRQSGPIYWAFDAEEKRAEVSYTWPVKVERAAMEITSEGYKAELEFEQTKVFGLFSIGGGKQREYAELEVTYLDLDLMVARGGGNTLYVLVQTNSNYRIGDTTSNNVNKQLR
jgi:Cof subfamily protein (haloacid dehalogenase superfamily)